MSAARGDAIDLELDLSRIHADGRVTFKEEAHKLIESLPDDSTWEDLMYEIHVHESVQRGLEDGPAGRIISSAEFRQRFNLPER